MATKSDFAQKLLSDLRLKKERMAASQSSNNSNIMARDGSRNSRQVYKGTQKTKGPEPVRPNTASSQRKASGSSRALMAKENSSQLVPYGSRQGSDQRGELSMAFLLALQNGGKHGRRDSSGNSSIIHFLQQIGKRSLDNGKMEISSNFHKHRPSTSQFPNFSNIHVNEISKGVQNLNQILRACSNGLNFDKYSIEVGKELLKGAMDLEESLRMLVNLQETSEYMIKPQRENRITLLEEDEDDEAENVRKAEQKQLDLPRFSFDKRSKNSSSILANNDFKQRLIELAYHAKTSSFSSQQIRADSNSEPHKRSASWCPPDSRTFSTFSESMGQLNSSQSKPEKARMSSIIAKLMGLEELPERVEQQIRQKESGPKQREGIVFKTTYAKNKNAERKTQQSEKVAISSNRNNVLKQEHKVAVTKNVTASVKAEKPQLSPQLADEKSLRKYERAIRTNEGSGLENTNNRTDKPQSDISHSNQIPEKQKNSLEKEKRQDSAKHNQQKSTEKDETKEREQQQKVQTKSKKTAEAANKLQEKTLQTDTTIQTYIKNSERQIPRKSQHDNGLHQLHMLQKSELQEEKNQQKKREQQNMKSNVQATVQNGHQVKSQVPPKTSRDATRMKKKQPHTNQAEATRRISTEPANGMSHKEQPENGHDENVVGDQMSTTISIVIDKTASSRKPASEIEREKERMPSIAQTKPLHVLATAKKVEIMQKIRGQAPRKIKEVLNKRNGTLNRLARPTKNHIMVIQEPKVKRHEKDIGSKGTEELSSRSSKEAEGGTKETKKSDENQPLNVEEHKHDLAATDLNSNASLDYECRSPEVAAPFTANDISKGITSEECMPSTDYHAQAFFCKEDSGQKSPKTISDSLYDSAEVCHPRQQNHKKAPTSWTQELLTENEKQLKEILIKSPLFLNTAEALFKLNIPVCILHASDQIYQDKATKLTTDCAFEVMNRKGRRQELVIQPCMKISIIGTTKVSSLDSLVKQLYKDFERLKLYENVEHDAAECLLKMLARDVQNTDPHLNCMWDFGWNEVMFALVETDDIIKDVEIHMLDELIDEITREL